MTKQEKKARAKIIRELDKLPRKEMYKRISELYVLVADLKRTADTLLRENTELEHTIAEFEPVLDLAKQAVRTNGGMCAEQALTIAIQQRRIETLTVKLRSATRE